MSVETYYSHGSAATLMQLADVWRWATFAGAEGAAKEALRSALVDALASRDRVIEQLQRDLACAWTHRVELSIALEDRNELLSQATACMSDADVKRLGIDGFARRDVGPVQDGDAPGKGRA